MIFFSCSKKICGLIAAYFFVCPLSTVFAQSSINTNNQNFAISLKELASSKNLENDPTWKTLLHVQNNHPNINDPHFLLSYQDFTLQHELALTIDFLYGKDENNVCRFPARYLWLRQALNAPELPLERCPDYLEFKEKAPLEDMALIFANENITQPNSMLGHAFLKFSGHNQRGQEVSHAISFFTDAETFNLPKLLFDSLVIGKNGYFALSPYADQKDNYLNKEQRSIWEYHLDLNAYQKNLIRLHLLELKQSKLTYFFQKYNCATVINFILSISGKAMVNEGWWITPRSLVKSANQAGLIDDTHFNSSNHWLVHTLASQLPWSYQQSIKQQVLAGEFATQLQQASDEKVFIQLELAKAYNEYAYFNKMIDKNLSVKNALAIDTLQKKSFSNKDLQADERFNPVNSPNENQMTFSALRQNQHSVLEVTILPIAHTLSDDNRSFSSENSLQLFNTTIKFNQTTKRVNVEQFTLYDMASLVPYELLTNSLSSHVGIGMIPLYDKQHNLTHTFRASGAIGIDERLFNDVDIYTLVGAGLTAQSKKIYPLVTVESGLIVREVWNMKSLLIATYNRDITNDEMRYTTLGFTQVKFIDKNTTLSADFSRNSNQAHHQYSLGFNYKKIY